jgi:hypothetical protein
MKLKLLMFMCVLCLPTLSVPHGATAQDTIPPLPADLLFTTSVLGEKERRWDMIVRMDATTLELSPFYVDDEAGQVMPVSWSPDGNLLAIYRIMAAIDDAITLFPRQLCVVDRSGVLQRCMNDNPPMAYAGFPESDWPHYFPVVWGPDGQTIYFDTEYPNENSQFSYGHRLVEANVNTGETLRIVYDFPDPYPVMASPNLRQVAIGFEGLRNLDSLAYLVDLNTDAWLDVDTIMPNHTYIYIMCWPFSPLGNYFSLVAGYDLANYAPELTSPDDIRGVWWDLLMIFDEGGDVQHILGEPEGSPAVLWSYECPSWQPDEQAITFLAYDGESWRIMRYSLVDQQTTMLYELVGGPDREYWVQSPLIPSPEGTHIALTVTDGPYEDRLVAVLYPDGEIYRIPSPYRFGLYPLWVPPLEVD